MDYKDANARMAEYLAKHPNALAEDLVLNCDVSTAEAAAAVRIRDTTFTTQIGGDHYITMAIQPWEAMEAWMTPDEYTGYHIGVAISYLARWRRKGGVDDIRKAHHHLTRLLTYAELGDE